MYFIEVKALAGVNYIRAADVIAVQYTDRDKCTIVMSGGFTMACVEAASAISGRVAAAVAGETPGSPGKPAQGED